MATKHLCCVAVLAMVAGFASADPIAPDPFPVTGCFVQTKESCCNFAGLSGFSINCAGVAETCHAEIDSESDVFYLQNAVGAGYSPGNFVVNTSSASCVFFTPLCDQTGPVPVCGRSEMPMTFDCEDQVVLVVPPGGTNCDSPDH